MCVDGKNTRVASGLRASGGLQRRQGADETKYTSYGTSKQFFTLDGTANTRNKYTNGRFNGLFARKAGFTQREGSKFYKTVTTSEEKTQRNALNRTAVADQGEVLKKTRKVRSAAANTQQTSSLKGQRGRSKLRIDSASGLGSNSGGSGVSYSG